MSERDRSCLRCERLISEELQRIILQRNLFTFVFLASGDECADCRKKRCMKFFDGCGKDFIDLDEHRNVIVNWLLCLERGQMTKVAELLAALKVLSPCPKGNWLILDSNGKSLNPRTSFEHLYFTRREDALNYARLKFSAARHPWQIVHIDRVVSKGDVV